jgi:hypothetical protein
VLFATPTGDGPGRGAQSAHRALSGRGRGWEVRTARSLARTLGRRELAQLGSLGRAPARAAGSASLASSLLYHSVAKYIEDSSFIYKDQATRDLGS